MGKKKVRPKLRKHLGKTNPKIDVYDEWEHNDIGRDEQKAGLKRREQRWREMELEQKRFEKLQNLLEKRKKMMTEALSRRQPTKMEVAWLRCDYILYHMMEPKAYQFMDQFREKDPECYKYLYKIFMSPYMMESADLWIKYFASGGKPEKLISHDNIMKHYRKYKGEKSTIKIIHKGKEEHEL